MTFINFHLYFNNKNIRINNRNICIKKDIINKKLLKLLKL